MAVAYRKGKYMPLSETNVSPTFVTSFDGQHINVGSDRQTRYTMGNYLGGGIAGVVYEAFDRKEHQHVAIKMLNPVGYKLLSPAVLRRGEIVKHGTPVVGNVRNMTLENVYWLKVRNDMIPCYIDHTQQSYHHSCILLQLKELTLEMCVSLWRFDILESSEMDCKKPMKEQAPTHAAFTNSENNLGTNPANESALFDYHDAISATDAPQKAQRKDCPLLSHFDEKQNDDMFTSSPVIAVSSSRSNTLRKTAHHRFIDAQDTQKIVCHAIPAMPPKYKAFLQNRKSIYREIAHMHKLTGNSVDGYIVHGGHENVLKLYDVLEFLQPSKCTIFLVLELAYGGELFDRIRGDQGVEESVARRYLTQILSGVLFCHQLGIVHRDLKPENLLLSDSDVLKIADFGLSAHFIAAVSNGVAEKESSCDRYYSQANTCSGSFPEFRRLNSVVGSPHYVAPEVLQNARYGYDGRKADMWSIGVILYGLLLGSLPFGKELSSCPRFSKFCDWIRTLPTDTHSGKLVFQSELYQNVQVRKHAMLSPAQSTSEESVRCLSSKGNVNRGRGVIFPSWLFPGRLSAEGVFLLACLLHPDPVRRFSCEDATKAVWVQLCVERK